MVFCWQGGVVTGLESGRSCGDICQACIHDLVKEVA